MRAPLLKLKANLHAQRSPQDILALQSLLQTPPPPLFKSLLQSHRLTHDSRQIEAGDVFIALKGTKTSGATFIPHIAEKASALIISAEDKQTFAALLKKLSTRSYAKIITIADTSSRAPALAKHFYAQPSKKLSITAVTGTNGKTSLTWILQVLSHQLGHASGLIGTINIQILHPQQSEPSILQTNTTTTPHPIDIQHALALMLENRVYYVWMEASSQGLKENRLQGLHLKSAIFTNLSQDHLDYHHTIEDYFSSKLRILSLLKQSAHCDKRFIASLQTLLPLRLDRALLPYKDAAFKLAFVIANENSPREQEQALKISSSLLAPKESSKTTLETQPNFSPLFSEQKQGCYTFSLSPEYSPELELRDIPSHFILKDTSPLDTSPSKNISTEQPTAAVAALITKKTNLIGTINGENLSLAMLEIAAAHGATTTAKAQKLWHKLSLSHFSIPGRMEHVPNPFLTVIIDYAHTPAGIAGTLKALRAYAQHNERLYILFGCGGDRDQSKRPLMGEVAYQLSDGIFLSSDNARYENPQKIITDIMEGIHPLIEADLQKKILPKPCHIIVDRPTAISCAISSLQEKSILLIAGKGHEQYEDVLGIKKSFNEKDLVLEATSLRKKSSQNQK